MDGKFNMHRIAQPVHYGNENITLLLPGFLRYPRKDSKSRLSCPIPTSRLWTKDQGPSPKNSVYNADRKIIKLVSVSLSYKVVWQTLNSKFRILPSFDRDVDLTWLWLAFKGKIRNAFPFFFFLRREVGLLIERSFERFERSPYTKGSIHTRVRWKSGATLTAFPILLAWALSSLKSYLFSEQAYQLVFPVMCLEKCTFPILLARALSSLKSYFSSE